MQSLLFRCVIMIFFISCKTVDYANDSHIKVIGGAQATMGQFPASLHIPGCSAVRVGKNHILTAAHCVTDDDGDIIESMLAQSLLIIRYGVELGKSKKFRLRIKKTVVHPQYIKRKKSNSADASALQYLADLAIIHLHDLPDTNVIPTATVRDTPVLVGDSLFFTGYGCEALPASLDPISGAGQQVVKQNDDDPYSKYRLKFKEVSVADIKNSVLVLGNERSSFLGFNQRGREDEFGGCPGDSGSAAYVQAKGQKTIVGINSYIGIFNTSLIRLDTHAPHQVNRWLKEQLKIESKINIIE
jgi:secreted trypsin-like serine protease